MDKNESFDELVARYGAMDNQIKTLTTEFNKDKSAIKDIMGLRKLDFHISGGYKVIRQVRTKVKVNEDKMLDILKEDWRTRCGDAECPYIKTREYIDSDALESALYKGDIPAETMAKLNTCQEKVEEIALKCVPVNEKED